jgi:hypothetical protein
MVVDPTAEYRAELKSLRDQVLQSIDGRVIGDLDDGLDLYEQLVRVTFRTRNELANRFGTATPTSWVNPYGRELEWLNDDIRAFIDHAWREQALEVPTSILHFLINLLETARRSNELAAHKQFLELLHIAFHRSLTARGHDDDGGARVLSRSNLAVLRSYGEYQLVHGLDTRSSADDDALLQVITSLFDDLRLTVELDPSSANACLVEITELLDAIDFTEGRTGEAGLSKAIDRISAYVVGVAAYVMMRADRARLAPAEATELLRALRPLLDRAEPWRTLRVALAESGDGFPWDRWELGLWPDGQRTGMLGHMESSIRRVTAVILVKSAGASEEAIHALGDLMPIEAEAAVGSVAAEVPGLIGRPWLVDAFPELADGSRVQRAEMGLKQLLDHFKAEVEKSRAERALDPRKVKVLADAVESSWLEASRLRGPLRANSTDPPESDVMFGYSSLVPKDYFTDSEVHAEPSRLGETIGRALARGETEVVLKAVSGLEALQVPGSGLRVAAKGAVDTLRGKGFDPSIVVVNSWRAAVELGGGRFDADSDEKERFEGAHLEIEYSDGPAICLVADLSRLLRIRRWTVHREKSFDVILAGGLLLLGVEEMTAERANLLVSENLEFRRASDETLTSTEDAVRRLLGQAHVRALTQLDVQIADNSAGVVIAIPDDAAS